MIHPILLEGDERLTKASEPIIFLEDAHEIIADMKETLLANMETGLGLAASQIGFNVNILIMREGLHSSRTPVAEKPLMAMINPVIKKVYPGVGQFQEGCLSIPDKTSLVNRALELKVQYTDEKGNITTVRLKGTEAVVFQHEYDHLQGKLMTTTEGNVKNNPKPGFETKEIEEETESNSAEATNTATEEVTV